MRHQTFTVFADYFQFYLRDAEKRPPVPELWTDSDVSTRAKVAEYLLVVCPERNMEVPVRIELHDAEPPLDSLDPWSHVVECALDLPSGRLLLEECIGTKPLAELAVERGTYQVRVLYGDLDALSEDALSGDDHYTVQLWPGSHRELSVRKQWPHERPG